MTTLEEKIEKEIAPLVQDFGCEVVKVSIITQNRNKVLQIMIEESNGNSATIDDCQRISRALSLKLDVINPIVHRYTLEVSSAGIERPLTKPKDFMRFCGKPVVVKTFVSKAECKTFRGNLESATENGIQLRLDIPLKDVGDRISLSYEEISGAHIDAVKI